MVVPLRRIFASLVVLFCSLGLGNTAFADGPTVYKGRWRVHLTKQTFEAALKKGELLGKHATRTECCKEDAMSDCCIQ